MNWGDVLPVVQEQMQPQISNALMWAAEDFLSDLWQELQAGHESASGQETVDVTTDM